MFQINPALLAVSGLLLTSAVPALAQGASEPDHVLRATPDTVHWGYFSPDLEPVLTIQPGDTVKIETVNSAGFPMEDPAGFAEKNGLPNTDAVADLVSIIENVEKEGVHILTGPIYIEGAEPGDMIEMRVHDVAALAPFYGVNLTTTTGGALPGIVPEGGWSKVFLFDMEREMIPFNESIEVPMAPFMGIMGLAAAERVPSPPPGRHGGNIDLKEVTAGTTLFLPVAVEGALFSTGDGHAAQGDGESNLTAVESPLEVTVEFILHKDTPMNFPLLETATHFIPMGLDPDLDLAAEYAVQESIDFLSARFGLDTMEAYSLTSIGVDLEVSQIVDGTKGVHAMIPKSLFLDLEDDFWAPAAK
ncbi:acetamidase/formamidase family protein [Devosia submarina]|uniref:acetamidase/formamidase family protein n=1 Tax=Devosia submarina TaxID=1173082 RepID=UPI000D38AA63|nr:acetamidase/formamidase family protein [Devosia submarina]